MYLRLFFVYSGAVSAPLVFCPDPNRDPNAEKSGRNQQISAGFGRSVGIRTRGLLVPKVGRIFFTDISGHFCTFPLGKFHSGVLSCTNKST